MSLPANTTIYTIGSTTFVSEPSVLDVLNAVAALATTASRTDLLPVSLCNLEAVLIALGATLPADRTLVVGSTTFIFRSSFADLLAAARALGA